MPRPAPALVTPGHEAPPGWPSQLTKEERLSTVEDMTTVVNIGEAKTQLSALIARAEKGEDIVVARAGKPVVRLTPVEPRAPRFGTFPMHVPDSFFEPLPEEELAAWE